MTASPMVLQHALAAALIAVYPAWDLYDTRELRAGTDPREKLRYYQRTLGFEWIAAALAVWAMGPKLFFFRAGPPGFASSHSAAYRAAGYAAALIIVLLVLYPHIQALRKPHVKERLRQALKRLQFILPATKQEERWFVALSVTAGICEETLYRGFLIRYLGRDALHLGMIGAVVIAMLAFGAAHLYQGVQSFVNTTIGGLLFSLVFLLTGNLALPIVFHVAADYLLLPIIKDSSKGEAAPA
jgi:uncharacterized protein